MLAFEEEEKSPAIIKVVGVGGAGMNAVERMFNLNLSGVEIIAMNTDEQVLKKKPAHKKVHLGTKMTRGMGAGGRPEVGAQAALEDRDKIVNVLKGADMVFITAGMGGGTGTGASPIVAEVAKEMKALTVGVVSMPFKSEGRQKSELAKKGQNNLREKVDTLITIPNDAIFKVIDRNTPINLAFKAIDDVLAKSVKGISDIINSTGVVNVDFADVRTVMSQNGDAVIGVGFGEGESRISDALQQAIHHPLLEDKRIDGATAVLINVVGGNDLTMYELNEIQETIHEMVSKEAHMIVGFTEDPGREDQVNITVIATGFESGRPMSIDNGLSADSKNKTSASYSDIYSKPKSAEEKTTEPQIRFSKNNLDYTAPQQQGLNFPNVETDLEKLNIPAFLRKNK
ncbi:MAG: cell division protein FtsZ [Spirochaetia bacterium]|nr:cell division protein FtsZ [Spirochaetia bacterium]